MFSRTIAVSALLPIALLAQPEAKVTPDLQPADAKATPELKPGREKVEGDYTITPGTRIPLNLINSVSTKHAAEGDRIYLETVFPIMAGGRIVIPPGSYVAGTVTQVKRPGRVRGKGELYVRFDSLTLPNGTTRDFRARLGALEGRSTESLDRAEGKVKGGGNVGGDSRTIGEAAATGASVGGIAGAVGGRPVAGLVIGAAGGAAAALVGVLLSRGPDAVLAKGTTLEMVVDRPLVFEESELMTGPLPSRPHPVGEGDGPMQRQQQTNRRFPL